MATGPYSVKRSGNYTWIERDGQKISCVYTNSYKADKRAVRQAQELVELANRQVQGPYVVRGRGEPLRYAIENDLRFPNTCSTNSPSSLSS